MTETCPLAPEIAELQAKVHSVCGNGRPGMIDELRQDVKQLQLQVGNAIAQAKVWGIVASATWAVLMAILVAHLTGRLR